VAASEESLRKFVAAWNHHDADEVMSFFADDCVFETPRGPHPWGDRLVGKQAVRRGVEARFSGIPDVHYGNDEHWLLGEHAVSKWTLTGTTTDGERIEVCGCDLFDLDAAGRVTRKDSYWKIVTA
jgi:ketosteroid isomerase-like protein